MTPSQCTALLRLRSQDHRIFRPEDDVQCQCRIMQWRRLFLPRMPEGSRPNQLSNRMTQDVRRYVFGMPQPIRVIAKMAHCHLMGLPVSPFNNAVYSAVSLNSEKTGGWRRYSRATPLLLRLSISAAGCRLHCLLRTRPSVFASPFPRSCSL